MKTVKIGKESFLLKLTIGACEQILAELEVDLLQPDPGPFYFLQVDERASIDIIKLLIRDQAKEKKIDLKTAFNSLDGEEYGGVKKALMEELEDFFRKISPQKLELMKMIGNISYDRIEAFIRGESTGSTKSGEPPVTSG